MKFGRLAAGFSVFFSSFAVLWVCYAIQERFELALLNEDAVAMGEF